MTREDAVVVAFVAMANSLAEGADTPVLLNTLTSDCARLLDVNSAGLLLADRRGALHVGAASSEHAADLEAFQVQREQGPCHDCYRDGRPVLVPDVAATAERWPAFTRVAARHGIASVHAVPLRLHGEILGALGLFGSRPGELNERDIRLAQALADVAAVALVQDRLADNRDAVNDQLQLALDSRVLLEQAKGALANEGRLDMAQAYTALVAYSRDHNIKIAEVARAVVGRALPASTVLAHQVRRRQAAT